MSRSIKVLVINHTVSCPLGWHHIIYSQVLSSILNVQVLYFAVSLVYLCVVLLVQCPRANWLSNRKSPALYTNQKASSRRGLSDVIHRPTSSPWRLVCWHTVQVTQRLSASHNPLRYTTPNPHLLHMYRVILYVSCHVVFIVYLSCHVVFIVYLSCHFVLTVSCYIYRVFIVSLCTYCVMLYAILRFVFHGS